VPLHSPCTCRRRREVEGPRRETLRLRLLCRPRSARTELTSRSCPQLEADEFRRAHFEHAGDYEVLVRKLQAVGRYLAAFTERLKQAMAKGITQPHVAMERVQDEIAANIAKDPAQSPFYAPFKDLPTSIPSAEQAKLRSRAKAAITVVVNPAYGKFMDFFRRDYLPRAPRWAYPACRTARPTTTTSCATTPPPT